LTDPPERRDRASEVVSDLVEYLIITAPDVDSLGTVAEALADLVRAGTIELLDLVVLAKGGDGAIDVLELEAVDSLAALREVEGELGAMLSEHDLELASFASRVEAALADQIGNPPGEASR
jgi:hypothetical protein